MRKSILWLALIVGGVGAPSVLATPIIVTADGVVTSVSDSTGIFAGIDIGAIVHAVYSLDTDNGGPNVFGGAPYIDLRDPGYHWIDDAVSLNAPGVDLTLHADDFVANPNVFIDNYAFLNDFPFGNFDQFSVQSGSRYDLDDGTTVDAFVSTLSLFSFTTNLFTSVDIDQAFSWTESPDDTAEGLILYVKDGSQGAVVNYRFTSINVAAQAAATVPEPDTFGLMALSLGLMLVRQGFTRRTTRTPA